MGIGAVAAMGGTFGKVEIWKLSENAKNKEEEAQSCCPPRPSKSCPCAMDLLLGYERLRDAVKHIACVENDSSSVYTKHTAALCMPRHSTSIPSKEFLNHYRFCLWAFTNMCRLMPSYTAGHSNVLHSSSETHLAAETVCNTLSCSFLSADIAQAMISV